MHPAGNAQFGDDVRFAVHAANRASNRETCVTVQCPPHAAGMFRALNSFVIASLA